MSSMYDVSPKRTPEMELLGLPMNRAGIDDVHAFIRDVVSSNQQAIALNLNVYCVNLAMENAWLHEFIRGVQLVFCDGDGVRMGLKLCGFSPGPKITYNKWIWQLSEFCERERLSIYFLGGRPGVADEAVRRLRERFPALKVAGTQDGYFRKSGDETLRVIDAINATEPDILLVCMGMPTQERWIMDNWRRIRAHVFLKGGAALDYAAGRLGEAPGWMVRCHLEWFFRLLQEPVRLFTRYVIGNPLFLLRVLPEAIGRRRKRR